jgi:hypothetical protein
MNINTVLVPYRSTHGSSVIQSTSDRVIQSNCCIHLFRVGTIPTLTYGARKPSKSVFIDFTVNGENSLPALPYIAKQLSVIRNAIPKLRRKGRVPQLKANKNARSNAANNRQVGKYNTYHKGTSRLR